MSDWNAVADVLDKAHDELLLHGWCGEWIEKSTGEHCALGAIAVALDLRDKFGKLRYPRESEFGKLVTAQLAEAIGSPVVIEWNEEDGRTIDDVLDAFRKASKNCREKAGQS